MQLGEVIRGLLGLGWTIETSEGSYQSSKCEPFVISPLIAESLAMRKAILRSKELGILKVKCESDSKQLIKAIKEGNSCMEIYGIVADIIALSGCFESIWFNWIPREDNVVADTLAKQCLVVEKALMATN